MLSIFFKIQRCPFVMIDLHIKSFGVLQVDVAKNKTAKTYLSQNIKPSQ